MIVYLSIPIFLVYLATVNPWASVIGDNIVYLRDAQRLWAGLPLLDHQYGPGLKLWLSPWAGSMVDSKIMVALLSCWFPVGVYLVLRRWTVWYDALIVAVLAALLPITVQYGAEVMADVPYAALSMLALVATLRWIERDTWGRLAWAALAIWMAYLVKSPALLIPLSAAVWLVWRREWRPVGMILAVAVAAVLPTLGGGYTESVTAAISRGENIPAPGGFWHNLGYLILFKNPHDYLVNAGALFGLPLWGGIIIIALVALGFTWSVLGLYFLGYLGLLFLLPGAPLRYLIPVVPLILWYGLSGLDRLAGYTIGKTVVLTTVAAVAILGYSAVQDYRLIDYQRSQVGYPGAWGDYYQACQWLKVHTPTTALIASRKPTLTWYWSGRESELYPWVDNADLSRFDYAIVDNLFPQTARYLVPALGEHGTDYLIPAQFGMTCVVKRVR